MRSFKTMKFAAMAATALLAGTVGASAHDQPKPKGGAVKGAAVGAVAGHMMGHHTKTGAAIGAVAGHHEKVKSEKRISKGGNP